MKLWRLRWVFVALATSASLASMSSPAAAQDGGSATEDMAVATVSPRKDGHLTTPPAPARPDFGAQADALGLTTGQAASLQQRVDAVLAAIPGGRQVSLTEIRYDGLVVTFDPWWGSTTKANAPAEVVCSPGWFCIVVRGTTFSFFNCQWWDLTNWWGNSPYNNNQTTGTVFRAYDQNYNQVWSSTAKATGSVDVTPWWHIKPC